MQNLSPTDNTLLLTRIVQSIQEVSSTKAKQEILKECLDIPNWAECVRAAYDYRVKYFLKKIPKRVPAIDSENRVPSWEQIKALLDTLSSQAIRGNGATEAVSEFINNSNELVAELVSTIIKKDLRMGVNIKTLNAAGYKVPTFEVMLATDAKKTKNLDKLIQKGVFVSPKLDGFRMLAVCDDGDVTLYTRSGHIFENFPDISHELSRLSIGRKFILDGEVISDDFQSMQRSAFANKRKTAVGISQYHVFGFVPYDELKDGVFKTEMSARDLELSDLFHLGDNPLSSSPLIKRVPQTLVNKLDMVSSMELDYMHQGYEGLMAIPADSPYYFGRKANNLLKFKTILTQDCVIVSIYEGEGRLSGTMGGIVVRQENDEICRVGSGFSDKMREEFWENKDNVIGRLVEVHYQELTPDGIMRFPIFKRFRDMGTHSDKV